MMVCCCSLAGTNACKTCPNGMKGVTTSAPNDATPHINYQMPTDCSHPTNADHIRAMSDEELAECLSNGFPQSICKADCYDDNVQCKDCLLEWLRKEAE